ncbi:MAG: hypothetical protein QGH45_24590 [Myxococcota bacterium]|jgi:hypothetical protein|nr:hypothetical protein [Myxococcota bacterium]
MPCELCGSDGPLAVVPDVYTRLRFRICLECRDAHARVRPEAPDPRVRKPQLVGGADTRMPRLPPEIGCPICRGSGGEACGECGGDGGEVEQRPCSLCEGSGRYECYTCKGSGRRLLGPCPTCGGDRTVACEKCGGDGIETVKHPCATCHGSGRLCHRCDGMGTVKLYS